MKTLERGDNVITFPAKCEIQRRRQDKLPSLNHNYARNIRLTKKFRLVANHLRKLGNMKRGGASALLLPDVVATYEAEVWRLRHFKITRGRIGGTKMYELVQRTNIVLNTALRAMLSVYRTTTLAALNRELIVPPSSILLEAIKHDIQPASIQ